MRSRGHAVQAATQAGSTRHHDAIVVGGGPTGLMLAAELALAGIDVALVERRRDQGVPGTRALGLMPRAVETLDLRGIGDRFVSAGTTWPELNFHVPLDVSAFPTRRNFLLGLAQNGIEKLLAEWVGSLPIRVYRGESVVAVSQDEAGVRVTLGSGLELSGRYVAGCDGGRSVVRRSVGIPLEGWPASTSWVTAEVRTTSEPPWGFHLDAAGQKHVIVQGETPGHARMVLVEPSVAQDRTPMLDDVRLALLGAYATDFGVHAPTWISRFTDAARQAVRYREGRVLIAGDAAHVHSPLGGQGLGIGLQDAVNLGWKLAQVIHGASPDSLLDTYERERHPVAARVLQNTMALSALRRPDPHSQALARYFAEFLQFAEPRASMTAEISGLGTSYDSGGGHPLAGLRMPDADLLVDGKSTHAYRYLHAARPVLFQFGPAPDHGPDPGYRTDRLQVVQAVLAAGLELPVRGRVEVPPAMLVRPDGYIAWAGAPGEPGLGESLAFWFGIVR